MPSDGGRIGQLVSHVRVRMTRDVARLRVGGRELVDLRQGSQLTLPLWAAERVWDEGLAEPIEGVIDLSKLTQLAWRERRSAVELVELTERFYYTAASALAGLRERDPVTYKAFLESYQDIVSIRLAKILGFAARRLDPSLIKNMTEEEKELYTHVRAVVESWLESIGLGVK
ncbi:MAG: hypothetical protein QXQ48_08060 [Nitrososphaerota archaeon]